MDDFEKDWVYGSKFDFIHGRYLAGAVKDWPRLIGQAFKYEKSKYRLTHGEDWLIWNRFTKPGGWVEFQDFDMQFYTVNGEFTPSCSLAEWTKIVINGLKKAGVEPEPGPKLEGWVKEAGFTNIHHKLLPIPVGVWPKDKKLVSSPSQYSSLLCCLLTNFCLYRKRLVHWITTNFLKVWKEYQCISSLLLKGGNPKKFKSFSWELDKISKIQDFTHSTICRSNLSA